MKRDKLVSIEEVFKRAGITFCPQCHTGFADSSEKLSILNANMCLSCDHMEGEVLADKPRPHIDI